MRLVTIVLSQFFINDTLQVLQLYDLMKQTTIVLYFIFAGSDYEIMMVKYSKNFSVFSFMTLAEFLRLVTLKNKSYYFHLNSKAQFSLFFNRFNLYLKSIKTRNRPRDQLLNQSIFFENIRDFEQMFTNCLCLWNFDFLQILIN